MTHQDFVKQIKDLNDLCDYLVVDISDQKAQSNGLKQYYYVSKTLEKLLLNCNKARL